MTIVVDGKKRAQEIQEELLTHVTNSKQKMIFHIVYVGSDPVIDNYLEYKQQFAQAIGVSVKLHRFDADISQEDLEQEVLSVTEHQQAMIIQLPLPEHIDQQAILDLVPTWSDVDVLSSQSRELFKQGGYTFFPPVTGSIIEVFKNYQVDLHNKSIVVLGDGKLVGKPTMTWLDTQGVEYMVINKETPGAEREKALEQADLIISGVGIPNLILPEDVKSGVIIIDAGTSEAGKKVRGDVHPSVKDKASLFTPVPGGIGPLTIAILYRNVVHSYLHD